MTVLLNKKKSIFIGILSVMPPITISPNQGPKQALLVDVLERLPLRIALQPPAGVAVIY